MSNEHLQKLLEQMKYLEAKLEQVKKEIRRIIKDNTLKQ